MSGFGKKKKRTRDLSGYSEEELKEYYKNRLLYYLERRKTEKEAARHLRELNCPEELQEELLAFARESVNGPKIEHLSLCVIDGKNCLPDIWYDDNFRECEAT